MSEVLIVVSQYLWELNILSLKNLPSCILDTQFAVHYMLQVLLGHLNCRWVVLSFLRPHQIAVASYVFFNAKWLFIVHQCITVDVLILSKEMFHSRPLGYVFLHPLLVATTACIIYKTRDFFCPCLSQDQYILTISARFSQWLVLLGDIWYCWS